MNRSIAVLLLFLSLTLPGRSMAAETPALAASDAEIAGFFDDHLEKTVKELEIPGAALVVVRDGRTVLAKGYGEVDLASRRPIDVERSLFRAASISKLLPWVLVMQLVEQGRLDLDHDVQAYLDFDLPLHPGGAITLRHLMTHSAGFSERFHGVFDPDLDTPLGEVLRDNVPLRVHPPGEVVAYSNYGAALAGYIVTRQYGRSWEDIVQARIFDPVGMHRSTVAQPVPAAMADDVVATYPSDSNEPVPFRTTPLAPMGSLTASPADMGRFLAMLANGGMGEHGRVLRPDTVQRMLALQRPLGPGLPDGLGLGFLVGEYRGIRYAGHAGNMSTLATDLQLLPDHGLGWYYVLSAQGPGERGRKVRDALLRAAVDRFLVPGAPEPLAHGPSTAEEVAGSYTSTRRLHAGPLMFSGLMDSTRVTATADGGLVIASSGTRTRWLADGPDRFLNEATGIPLAITRDGSGEVVRIASAALYPVAEYERAPVWLAAVPGLAAFAVVTLAFAPVFAIVAWGVRRFHKGPGPGPTATPRRRLRSRKWARAGCVVVGATILAWAALGLGLAMDFSLLFTLPAAVRWLLAALAALSVLAAAAIAFDAVLALRDPGMGLASRLGRLQLAAAALVLAGLVLAFDMINFSADW